jgi:hypothetical protein
MTLREAAQRLQAARGARAAAVLLRSLGVPLPAALRALGFPARHPPA